MNETLRLHGVAAAVALLIATGASAQNLTITNARIIDGTGRAPIERGTVVISGGRITAVGTHHELLRTNAEYAHLMSGTSEAEDER